MTNPDPIACAALLITSFVLAGVAQTAWFRTTSSRLFLTPLDGGLTLRGRRIFGDNKTWRGLVVMIPATSVAFALMASIARAADVSVWVLPIESYGTLGAWAGLGFMAGELPNSFVKRQLDIPPGHAAASRVGAPIQLLIDRVDSCVGMLVAISVIVPVPWMTWTVVLAIGPFIHWLFSVLMFLIGIKPRPA